MASTRHADPGRTCRALHPHEGDCGTRSAHNEPHQRTCPGRVAYQPPPPACSTVRHAYPRVHGLPNSGQQRLRCLNSGTRNDDIWRGGGCGGSACPTRHVHRSRRNAGGHGRCVLRGRLRGDHRPVACRTSAGCDGPGGAGHEGALPDGGRAERCRTLRPSPDQSSGRFTATTRGRCGRPLPGPRLRPAYPAGRDPPHLRRLHPGRQDPLLRSVELHRLAADESGSAGQDDEPGGTDHPAAAVQPAGSGDRMGDRAGCPGRRPRAAAVVTVGRRLALRQVPAQRTAHRQHPAG